MNKYKFDNLFSINYFRKLTSELSPIDVATTFFSHIHLAKNKNAFERIFRSQLPPQNLIVIISLIINLTIDQYNFVRFEIINHVLYNEFFDNMVRFLRGYNNYTIPNIYVNINEELSILVTFFECTIHYVPICDIAYEKIFHLIQLTLTWFEKCDQLIHERHLFERMNELKKLLIMKVYYIDRNNFDYTDLSLFPSPVDLYEDQNLSPCTIEGAYDDVKSYVDVNYKILKQDYIRTVQESIEEYRAKKKAGHRPKKLNCHIFKAVKSSGIVWARGNPKSKICHNIMLSQEDEEVLTKENLQAKKRFMNGSLLYFTRNDFTTFIIGTVEDNEVKISSGKNNRKIPVVQVSIVGNPYDLVTNTYYDMMEPNVFFEPYFRSLKIFQSVGAFSLPMSKYIVFTDMENITTSVDYLKNALSDIDDLNESQSLALKTALSQKFTLIQGPPGSGKSHLTRKLINIMSDNKTNRNPILVICSRNNALDIILEPLAIAGRKVLRLGSQTKSEFLKDCTLIRLKTWFLKGPVKKELTTQIKQLGDIITDPEYVNKPEAIKEAAQKYEEAVAAYTLYSDYNDGAEILSRGIEVIGATTTGAARKYRMLSQMKPKAVIIEEAAEILEPFLVSCIPEHCEHLILIGDHLQLQPSPAWNGSKSKHLNISLFERMINNGIEYCTLAEQHRMRPDIASLISPLIYKELKNHPKVEKYPDVIGVNENVYFVKHKYSESPKMEDFMQSFWNKHEAEFLLGLANYLILQGYKPSEITILTGYSAQQDYLVRASFFDKYPLVQGVQIKVIDNFQGEENKIILLSLVRSNTRTIGFLKTSNRINVALSRAKHGLYIIGNMDTLSACSDLWVEIENILEKQLAIGIELPLQCKTHKNVMSVSRASDFLRREFGGCNSKCLMNLECGHVCNLICHASMKLHESTHCLKPCLRKKICGRHNCEKSCWEECGPNPCMRTRQFSLKCKHKVSLPCSYNFDGYNCIQPCKKLRACEKHECNRLCHEECGPCMEVVQNHVFDCGHSTAILCYKLSSYSCKVPCDRSSCGKHKSCPKSCFEPCDPCQVLEKKVLKCGHVAELECSYELSIPSTWGTRGPYHCLEEINFISELCGHLVVTTCWTYVPENKGYRCVHGCFNWHSICTII